MPEPANPKSHPHPWRLPHEPVAAPPHGPSPYVELAVTTNFTFLTGASHAEELASQAAALGYSAMAVTDTNTLAGVVRAHVAAKEAGVRLIVGCRLKLADVPHLPGVLVYPTDRASYGRLCRLLTTGKRQAPKGQCHLTLHDLIAHQEGLLAIAVPPADVSSLDELHLQALQGLAHVFDDDRFSIAMAYPYSQDDRGYLRQVADLCDHLADCCSLRHVPAVATNDVHYHVPQRRPLQDVLTCIRHGCSLDQAGFLLHPNAERHLKPPQEMARLFAQYPRALSRTLEIAQRCEGFTLDQLRYEYPDEVVPAGKTPMEHLIDLTWAGARDRYPRGIPTKVRQMIEHEFQLIEELRYAPYFLTVHDLVTFARSRGILCQGRGAAANSAVCFCLGVTSVDPDRVNMLFERFVSRERNEPPDIDIDFEHQRREEVIQYIYAKYGRERAALTAEVISYRPRSATRDVGKALGLSLDTVDKLAKNLDWWDHDGQGADAKRFQELGLNPADPTLRKLAILTRQIQGFPRHLSQHVGGFVITRGPLCESVPIENAAMVDRTVIEWDKDDIDAMGMLKVDVLGLGMLSAIRRCIELINQHDLCRTPDGQPLAFHTIPPEDPAVYDMLCKADTVGVFQIESRAQMSMLPRLRPRCYYDLVIEVAIVRPGPIQGDMVHPYLRRRRGEEPVEYPSEQVRHVLGRTLGIPLFQEQAMQLAMVAAGFTPGEADQLRRAIASWKSKRHRLEAFAQKFIAGMIEHGYPREFAVRCFSQFRGFADYGFPESHAASFALLVYVSAWLKRHHPAAFACALLNSQPMGFYAPAQIVRDAQDHGVVVLPVDIHHSQWECTLPPEDPGHGHLPGTSLRLGMCLVHGLNQHDAEALTAIVVEHGPFTDVETLWRHCRSPRKVALRALRHLASADAFGSMGLDRQQALWKVRALDDTDLPLFDALGDTESPAASIALPVVPEPQKVIHDYATVGLSLRAHPLSFLRPQLDTMRVTPANHLKDPHLTPERQLIAVAGIVLVRQHPSTAKGITFMTLEDETGITNLIVRPAVFARYRQAARHATITLAHGFVERQGDVVHVLVLRIQDLSPAMAELVAVSRDFR